MIGGIGVTRGYLHAPELTRKSFLQNPIAEGIVYRTGDLVRRLSCGNYVFMRRLDDQVEIGGFRIQLAEIECVFQQHIFVEQAVVVVREGVLVAYLKILGARILEDSELTSITLQASQSLTHYIIPQKVLLQGLRGLLTLMVLCDHLTTLKYDFAILADTSLFVVLSGISTALQMRDQHLIEVSDYLNFMGRKCIGIFPILWITLLLHIARLVLQFVYLDPSTPWITIAGCVALNVIAIQTNVPICAKEGPSISTYYASAVFNTFIIYGLLRYLQTRPAVNRIMQYSSCSFLDRAKCSMLFLSECYLYSLFASVLCLVVFMLASLFELVYFGFFPYFFGGYIAASVLSCFHAALERENPIQICTNDEEVQAEQPESTRRNQLSF